MRVRWSTEAKEAKKQVSDYIRREFGVKRARRFKDDVDKTVEMIRRSPNIGQIDPLFDDMPIAFRSVIINGLNKMVYYVEDNILNIAAFWDTRVDADEQARLLKQ